MWIEDIMFSLLRSELSMSELDSNKYQDLSYDTYSKLYILSKKHDISHIIASALFRMKILDDDETSNNFKKSLMMAIYRDSQREYEIEQLSTIFENAKIPHILLKGAIIRNLYPQTWMRTSCDIDVLVQMKDTETAIEALCNAGYVRMKDCSTHDHNFVSPNKVHIELHYTLTQEGQLTSTDKILESVWESYSTLIDGYSYRYNMTVEMFVIYHLAHMARHLVYCGCGIRPFIDLWLIKRHMVIDDKKLYALLNQTHLLQFYKTAIELGTVWLEAGQHNESTKYLEVFILNGGVYGTVTNAAKVQAARGFGKGRYLLKLMFLPRKNLEVLYPNLKKHPILYPFYQIKRWFRFFYKDKRYKVKHLTDQRKNVTTDEMNETERLLDQLGLI